MSTRLEDTQKVISYLDLYRHMITARELDALENELMKRGEAFFHVSGAGHEGIAALAPHLTPHDWLHVHYRDKALMLARGVTPESLFLGLFGKDRSSSRGRQMCAHISEPALKILASPGPVGNGALQAAGVASVVKNDPERPIVLCALGDGMTQEGEVIEAIGHAVRDGLPVLFLIEDNSYAISTKTGGRTFFSLPEGPADSFYSLPITRIDGCDIPSALEAFGGLVRGMREDRKPRIAVFEVERLTNHTNADDHRVYRSEEEIRRIAETSDPIAHLRRLLLEQGADETDLEELRERIGTELREIARQAQKSSDPKPVFTAKQPLPTEITGRPEYLGTETGRTLTMLEAIRGVLHERMGRDERITLFGEDIEDPKGDVFGVTRGLTAQYPGRVVNSPLSESCILGVTIGQALAGSRPVAFIQFADFLPIAYNQIFAELGSMYWRTDGGWQAPVIVMITCGGYKPGLGPFHASSLEALGIHTPGVDVFMPSTAADAAGMLNAAFDSGRPTLFFYPKICLNDRENGTSPDLERQFVPIGKARIVLEGTDITLVGWGNTVPLCRKAAVSLAEAGVSAEVIDLRSLSPWDEAAVIRSAEKTGRLIVTHEDNHSCGMGAEVIATVTERAKVPVTVRRVTRADTFVPFNFENQLEVLPSYKRILETASELLGYRVTWVKEDVQSEGVFPIPAVGSSPSDESVTVIEWHVKPGDLVSEGALLASLEADKAVQELLSPAEGKVHEILVPEGDMVKVGTIVVTLETADEERAPKPVTKEDPGTPFFRKLGAGTGNTTGSPAPAGGIGSAGPGNGTSAAAGNGGMRVHDSASSADRGGTVKTATASDAVQRGTVRPSGEIGIAEITSACGSRIVSNDRIAELCRDWTAGDILKRTGIESRFWVSDDEDALSIAVDAVRKLLETPAVKIERIGLIVCATGTPVSITPSMACLIQNKISRDPEWTPQAHDISAACSGYLYALQQAYDHVRHYPDQDALVVTTETLSRKLDPTDPSTAPIFGDAATATLVTGRREVIRARLYRPVLAANGEDGTTLSVPLESGAYVSMDGPKVFLEAIKSMTAMLKRAGDEASIPQDRIDLIVPHQANQRIINAIRQKLSLRPERVYSNIRAYGNTSSSSIPLCIEKLFAERGRGEILGLCAFGGGFTSGGAIVELV